MGIARNCMSAWCFWATVEGAHTETKNPSDSSWDITINKMAAHYADLRKAHTHTCKTY